MKKIAWEVIIKCQGPGKWQHECLVMFAPATRPSGIVDVEYVRVGPVAFRPHFTMGLAWSVGKLGYGLWVMGNW